MIIFQLAKVNKALGSVSKIVAIGSNVVFFISAVAILRACGLETASGSVKTMGSMP